MSYRVRKERCIVAALTAMTCPGIAMAHGSGGGIAIVMWAIAIPCAAVWAIGTLGKLIYRLYRWWSTPKPIRPKPVEKPPERSEWEKADARAKELWKKGKR